MSEKRGESAKFSAMLGEVEAIVANIESGDMDLDDLVEKIEVGYGLIRKMRLRLDETKQKIETLRVEYEAEAQEPN